MKTGDQGEIDEQGRLKLTGRVKELFKTARGKYVAPAPIESKLSEFSGLDSICVTGNGFSQPIALATLSPELTHKLKDDNFKNELTQQLTKFLEAITHFCQNKIKRSLPLKLSFKVLPISIPWKDSPPCDPKREDDVFATSHALTVDQRKLAIPPRRAQ
jgi:long-subunit acyl-CoA synthetase (AMP-forming)